MTSAIGLLTLERRGVASDATADVKGRSEPRLEYLERALRDASSGVGADTQRARVAARIWEWWDATMLDEIAESARTGSSRSPDWWAEKFLEFRSMAQRETMDGVELVVNR